MLKMRVKSRIWGLTARFLRFFELFGACEPLRAEKQPEIHVSSKGLHPTTHNWLAMRTLSPAAHLSGIVGGSRMNPDVRSQKL